ncbi:unnamed protein product [Rhodiola kirilowii]
MEAIRKQASKLREQVAKQQQAVFKQFGAGGYGGPEIAWSPTMLNFSCTKGLKGDISTRTAKVR